MDYNTFNLLLQERLQDIETTLINKGREYVRGEDRFHNFKKGAKILKLLMPDIEIEHVMFFYATKHLVSILDILNDSKNAEKLNKEIINEKFGDLINYLIMIEISLLDKIKK